MSPIMMGAIRALALLALGLPLTYLLCRRLRASVSRSYSMHHGHVVGQLSFYTLVILIVAAALNQLGFSLAPLLGAAGVFGIAIGFASQTSVSNIISGLFILTEQPFAVGDVITVDTVTGMVLSIDLLAVKVRCFDNRFVRIPNESIIKNKVTNVTRFPIRRVDLDVPIAYKEDAGRVKSLLLAMALEDVRIFRQPEPLVVFKGFGASSFDLMLAFWVKKEDFFAVKNGLTEKVKARLDGEGIEIPYPHVKVYAGSQEEAISVRVLSD